MRTLGEIDAEIEALLLPYNLTLSTYLPAHGSHLFSLTPLPPGCMEAADYLRQVDTYASNVAQARAELARIEAQSDATERAVEEAVRSVDRYSVKLYQFSQQWRPVRGAEFKRDMERLLRERIETVLSEHKATAERFLKVAASDALA